MQFTAATITLSDLCAAGRREDRSGAILRELLAAAAATLADHLILPDEQGRIQEALLRLSTRVDVIITTGGTGISPRDVTPDATEEVIEKRIPGIEEALHRSGGDAVPTSILSRAIAGVRDKCLIVNLPGSPGGVRDGMAVLAPILPHAVRVLRGEVRDCREDLSQEPPKA